MPRGVPKSGFRMTKKRRLAGVHGAKHPVHVKQEDVPLSSHETDAQIWKKLEQRFGVLESLTHAATNAQCRALIVSGPAGLSKSYTVERILSEWDPTEGRYRFIKGYVRHTGLYKALYQNRFAGNVLVFDDADSIFFDDISLNFLKAALDTTERRRISYCAETTLVDEEEGTPIPSQFEFDGTCIFITNYDFDAMIDKGHKLAPHLQALVSRAHYIDLAMKTRRDYFIRILQVSEQGLFDELGLTKNERKDVLDFLETNIERVRELSLRTAIKVGNIRKFDANWKDVAEITTLRNK